MSLGTEAGREEGSRTRLDSMRRIMAGLARTVERHRFAIAAFPIPLTIRAVPEILLGPYPVGWEVGAGVGSGARDIRETPGGLEKKYFLNRELLVSFVASVFLQRL